MNVPLWLYVLTTFGVAIFGVGGVMLSNQNHTQQTDKRLRVERNNERERWERDQRLRVYADALTFFRKANAAATAALDGSNEARLSLHTPMAFLGEFRLIATSETYDAGDAVLSNLFAVSRAIESYVHGRGTAARLILNDVIVQHERMVRTLTVAMQRELGVKNGLADQPEPEPTPRLIGIMGDPDSADEDDPNDEASRPAE